MRAVSRFVGTTILGGVLLLTPIVVLGIVLSKAFDFMRRGLQPLTALIPRNSRLRTDHDGHSGDLHARSSSCFLAGLSARTALAQKVVNSLEAAVLSKLPGYEYLKEAGTSVLGLGEAAEHPVVFAHFGGAWRIGVQTDVVGAGVVAVFIPNSPNPMSGSVFLMPADQVRPANAPLSSAIACLRRCGAGSAAFAGEFSSKELVP